MKNCRALGPWFHRRLRTLLTSCGVHWKEGFDRVSGRDVGSDSRMSFATVASSEGGGDSGAVVRVFRGSQKRGFGGKRWELFRVC